MGMNRTEQSLSSRKAINPRVAPRSGATLVNWLLLRRSELKLQRKPGESVVFRCSRAANSVVSDGI